MVVTTDVDLIKLIELHFKFVSFILWKLNLNDINLKNRSPESSLVA